MDEQESRKDRMELQLQMDMLEAQQKIVKRLKGIDVSLGIIAFVFFVYFIIFPLLGISVTFGG
jgi:hypothetical protein